MTSNKIQLFEDRRIRTAWDEENEEWLFSIVDVVGVLTDTDNPRRYWSDIKRKIKAEGSQLYEKIVQLKMTAEDGKKRLTDVATTEQLLRIIQSIPSPKAEPFKLWLAAVGSERIDETIDPEIAINRALELVLNMLAEATTTEISRTEEPATFDDSRDIARRGGSVAGVARQAVEAQTGKPVITPENALDFSELMQNLLK